MEKTKANKEEAAKALESVGGDLAEAVLKLSK
jgi:NACalpha-BTF3-like transcription factor